MLTTSTHKPCHTCRCGNLARLALMNAMTSLAVRRSATDCWPPDARLEQDREYGEIRRYDVFMKSRLWYMNALTQRGPRKE